MDVIEPGLELLTPVERAGALPGALEQLGAGAGEVFHRLFMTSEGLYLVAGLVFVGYQANKWLKRNWKKPVVA